MSVDEAPSQELMHTRVEVEATAGPRKLVAFPATGERVIMGMHGPLAEFYGADLEAIAADASTLDYVVGATTACLLGTFKRALAGRGVDFESLVAGGSGEIVVEAGVPLLRSIEVDYRLTGTRASQFASIQRAHSVHHRACAVSRSLEGAIEIKTGLVLKDVRDD